ncbi:MAG: tetratricopeptide repeat protein [Myxococcota bacterium]
MRIECENCNAAYTIGDALLSDQPIGAQCPYCGHVRIVRKGDPPKASTAPTGSPAMTAPTSSNTGTGLNLAFARSVPPPPPPPLGKGPVSSLPAAPRSLDAPFGRPSAPPASPPPFSLGPGQSGRVDVSDLGVPAKDRFGAGDGLTALPPQKAPAPQAGGGAKCQVCGTDLNDEFDKVIGLCETHQRERSGQSDFGATTSEAKEWRVRSIDGSVAGPFSLSEIRNGLQDHRFGEEDMFSKNGVDFTTLDQFAELRSYSKNERANVGRGRAREDRGRAAPQGRSGGIGAGSVILGVLIVGLAAGGAYLVMHPAIVQGLIAQTEKSDLPSGPVPPNPIKRQLDKWRLAHPDASGTPDEHLATAKTRMLEDTWRSHQQAQDAFERVLLLDEDNPIAIAGYVENQVLWKAALLSEEDLRLLEAAVKFAVAVKPEAAPVQRARAAVAWARGDLNVARTAADKALALAPTDGVAHLYLSSSFMEGNISLAIKEAETAAQVMPQLRRADRVLARAMANAGRYASAVKLLDKRLANDPSNAAVVWLRADLDRELGNLEEAKKRYRTALQFDGDEAGLRLSLGDLLLELGDARGANDVLRSVVEGEKSSPAYRARALSGLARAELIGGKPKRAKEYADAALQLVPRDAGALLVAAEASLSVGSASTALSLAQRSLESRGGEPATLVIQARAHAALRQKEAALQKYEEAVQNDPRDVRLRGILAAAYLGVGGNTQAYTIMRRASEMDPGEHDARSRRGVFAISEAAVRDAIERFRESSRDLPEKSVAHSSAAILYYQMGELGRARELLAQALEADVNNAAAHLYAGQLALDRGAVQEAEEHAKKVLRADRGSAVGSLLLGRALVVEGKLKDATDAFDTALRSSKGLLIAEVEKASIDLAQGQKERALQSLIRAQTVNPYLLRTRRLLFEAGY